MTKYNKYLEILLYSTILAIMLLGMRFLEFKFMFFDHSQEIYLGAIALIFTGIGIWLAWHIFIPKVKEVIIEKEITILQDNLSKEIDTNKIIELSISPRELEILNMLATGLSNQEIGDQLFISLSTVKTHISNIFSKLNVKRRTQAIETARSLKLIV